MQPSCSGPPREDGVVNFHGNVEGNDIFKGTTDIVVCDGFVGNVALKTAEGLASMLSSFIKQEFTRNFYAKIAAVIALPVLNHFKKRVDPRRYNGAALLGLRGLVFKSHGSADAFAFRAGAQPRLRCCTQPASRAGAQSNRRVAAYGGRWSDRAARKRFALPNPSRMNATDKKYSRIAGTGSFLPPKRLTNDQLALQLAEQGGRNVRPVDRRADRYQGAPLCGARRGVERPGPRSIASRASTRPTCRPDQIDLIIVATSTPDMVFPSTACILQQKLGVHGCAAFDVQAVCSGFVYALTVADSMIRTGAARKALVVGSEVFSRILDFTDRTTCVLFGDGAGAVVLEASDAPGLLASELHADGRHVDILCTPGTVSGGAVVGDPLLKMDGPGRLQAGRRRSRRSGSVGARESRQDRRRCRLVDPASSQHPDHARHCQATEVARWNGSSSRSTNMATPRPPRSRWHSTSPCAAVRSSAAIP